MKFEYLFPFGKINKGSRILIYGAGRVGVEYLTQIAESKYCEIVGFVDQNYEEIEFKHIRIYSPDQIQYLEFDYLVITIRSFVWKAEIERILKEQKVTEEKIVWFNNEEIDIKLQPDLADAEYEKNASYADNKACAILVSGGIGDYVIQKRFVMELIKLLPDLKIDIFSVRNNSFVSYLYLDVPNINYIISDKGYLYANYKERYDLALELGATRYIKADVFNKDLFSKEHKEFVKKYDQMLQKIDKAKFSFALPAYVIIQREMINGYDVYRSLSCDGAFDIYDKNVNIPLTKEGHASFLKLGLKKYVTLNYGNGSCKDGTKIAKMWPLKYFEEFVRQFKDKYHDIDIVQLGATGSEKVKGANLYLFGEKYETVSYILKNAFFHLDIEGGLVHIASQLGTKCVVLFGPTPREFYGYKNNINLTAGNCQGCYGMYLEANVCARGMDNPECMYSISPDMVMEKVREIIK